MRSPDLDDWSVAEIAVELGLLLEMVGICTRLSSRFLPACPEQMRMDKLLLLALWLRNGPGSL